MECRAVHINYIFKQHLCDFSWNAFQLYPVLFWVICVAFQAVLAEGHHGHWLGSGMIYLRSTSICSIRTTSSLFVNPFVKLGRQVGLKQMKLLSSAFWIPRSDLFPAPTPTFSYCTVLLGEEMDWGFNLLLMRMEELISPIDWWRAGSLRFLSLLYGMEIPKSCWRSVCEKWWKLLTHRALIILRGWTVS